MLYLLAAVIFGLDQFIKWFVRTHMALGQLIPVIPGVFDINYIRNPGAAWGMLEGARWLLVFVALVVAAGVVYIERKHRLTWWSKIGLALVLGGALGNLTDRLVSGTVVDYLYVQWIQFPVFNLADSAVVVGIIMLVIKTLRKDSDSTVSSEDVEH